ncbi:MAG: DUF1634 domain-containing protein [Gloeotrichia echinulata IR180]|jgi:uncharacterized membrane protein|nr:DUF1634 domain-containing protein [Gloeotrichia echinulata DEX184]
MYKLNFGSRLGSSGQPESKVVAIPFQQQHPDSEITALDKQDSTKIADTKQLENWLSNLLKYGVIIASTVVLCGGILYLYSHGFEPAQYQFFQGEPSEFSSPSGVITAILSGSSRGIIQFGLLLLISTPIIRVLISLLAFLLQRDFTYVIVTLLVLAAITYSFVGAYY